MPKAGKVTLPGVPAHLTVDKGADGAAQPRRRWGMVSATTRPGAHGEAYTTPTRVRIRCASRVIEAMPAHLQNAAAAYADAFEVVEAGGVRASGDGIAVSVPQSDGRQFSAVGAVDHLRRLEAQIGPGVLALARSPRDARGDVCLIPHIEIVRRMVVRDDTIANVLKAYRIASSDKRRMAVLTALYESLCRISSIQTAKLSNYEIYLPNL